MKFSHCAGPVQRQIRDAIRESLDAARGEPHHQPFRSVLHRAAAAQSPQGQISARHVVIVAIVKEVYTKVYSTTELYAEDLELKSSLYPIIVEELNKNLIKRRPGTYAVATIAIAALSFSLAMGVMTAVGSSAVLATATHLLPAVIASFLVAVNPFVALALISVAVMFGVLVLHALLSMSVAAASGGRVTAINPPEPRPSGSGQRPPPESPHDVSHTRRPLFHALLGSASHGSTQTPPIEGTPRSSSPSSLRE